jgi:hypothetical protein
LEALIQVSATDPSGKFGKGNTFGSARKGSHNKTTRILKEAMLLAASQLGDLSGIPREDLSKEDIEKGRDELVGYLRWAGKCEPKSFLAILGKLLPLQVKVDDFTQQVYHSVANLGHDVSQRGLSLRGFGQLLLEAHKSQGEFTAESDDSDDGNGESGAPGRVHSRSNPAVYPDQFACASQGEGNGEAKQVTASPHGE